MYVKIMPPSSMCVVGVIVVIIFPLQVCDCLGVCNQLGSTERPGGMSINNLSVV
jgi:hypothetical protein